MKDDKYFKSTIIDLPGEPWADYSFIDDTFTFGIGFYTIGNLNEEHVQFKVEKTKTIKRMDLLNKIFKQGDDNDNIRSE